MRLEAEMSAEEQAKDGEGKKSSGSVMKIIIWLVVVIVSIGGGFATPIVIGQLTGEDEEEQTPVIIEQPEPEKDVEYIDFDEVVVNLREQDFSRYLKIKISLEVPKSQKADIEAKIEARKAVLLDRINMHFAEVTTEELKGQFGHNRLRREMHDYFNEILFDDGIERVQDILFRGLHVQ